MWITHRHPRETNSEFRTINLHYLYLLSKKDIVMGSLAYLLKDRFKLYKTNFLGDSSCVSMGQQRRNEKSFHLEALLQSCMSRTEKILNVTSRYLWPPELRMLIITIILREGLIAVG